MKRKVPLFVIVDKDNNAIASADDMATARNRQNAVDGHGVKLFSDHKGNKMRIGF